ncbi:hypothetical protein [Luteolibacter soli]|uniref:Uncharacterized protein n=1 Tax=Luteolibacter soli TaxID=3135280 RepID=A0ABU9AZG4_9BACT
MRDLSPDFADAIQTSAITPALLVHLDILGDPLFAWTGLGPVVWNGHTWLGLGCLAGVEPIEEYSDIRAGSLKLSLTEIPNQLLSELAGIVYKRRLAEVYLALFLGDTRTLIGVELLMRGKMDTLQLSRAPEGSTLRMTVGNELARLRDSEGSLYTDAHQQGLYPGDTSLRFVASLQDITIKL